MIPQKYRILIVEDDKSLAASLRNILPENEYTVEISENASKAQGKLTSIQIALIDLHLPDKPGIQLLKELKDVNPEAVAIIVTGFADKQSAVESLNLGAYAFLEKPVEIEKLLFLIKKASEKWQLSWELKGREQEIKGLTSMTGEILNDRVRILEGARKKEEQLSKLYQNINMASRSLDPRRVGKELLSLIADITGANHTCFVFLEPYDRDIDRVDYFRDIKPFDIKPRPGGTLDEIVRTRKPVFISDRSAEPDTHPAIRSGGFKSTAGYPLVVDEVIRGVLFLHSLQKDAFSGYKDVIAAFADLCVIPIKISLSYQDADLARREWRAMANTSPRGIAIVDLNRVILRSNRSFQEITGALREDARSKIICKLLHGMPEQRSGCPMEKACHSGELEHTVIEEPFLKIKKLDILIVPVTDREGKIVRYIHIMENLDLRK